MDTHGDAEIPRGSDLHRYLVLMLHHTTPHHTAPYGAALSAQLAKVNLEEHYGEPHPTAVAILDGIDLPAEVLQTSPPEASPQENPDARHHG